MIAKVSLKMYIYTWLYAFYAYSNFLYICKQGKYGQGYDFINKVR